MNEEVLATLLMTTVAKTKTNETEDNSTNMRTNSESLQKGSLRKFNLNSNQIKEKTPSKSKEKNGKLKRVKSEFALISPKAPKKISLITSSSQPRLTSFSNSSKSSKAQKKIKDSVRCHTQSNQMFETLNLMKLLLTNSNSQINIKGNKKTNNNHNNNNIQCYKDKSYTLNKHKMNNHLVYKKNTLSHFLTVKPNKSKHKHNCNNSNNSRSLTELSLKYAKYDTQNISYKISKEYSKIYPNKANNFKERNKFYVAKFLNKNKKLDLLVEEAKPHISENKRIEAFNRLITDANRRIEVMNRIEKMKENKNAELYNDIFDNVNVNNIKHNSHTRSYNQKSWEKIYNKRFKERNTTDIKELFKKKLYEMQCKINKKENKSSISHNQHKTGNTNRNNNNNNNDNNNLKYPNSPDISINKLNQEKTYLTDLKPLASTFLTTNKNNNETNKENTNNNNNNHNMFSGFTFSLEDVILKKQKEIEEEKQKYLRYFSLSAADLKIEKIYNIEFNSPKPNKKTTNNKEEMAKSTTSNQEVIKKEKSSKINNEEKKGLEKSPIPEIKEKTKTKKVEKEEKIIHIKPKTTNKREKGEKKESKMSKSTTNLKKEREKEKKNEKKKETSNVKKTKEKAEKKSKNKVIKTNTYVSPKERERHMRVFMQKNKK